MKKIPFLLLSFWPGGLAPQVSIVGKWDIETYIEKVTVSTGQVLTDTTESAQEDNVVFLPNGTEYIHAWYDLTFNYSEENKNVSLYVSTKRRDYSCDTVSYRVSGDQLIMSKDGYTDTALIKKLTDHEMVLYIQSRDSLAPTVHYTEETWRILYR